MSRLLPHAVLLLLAGLSSPCAPALAGPAADAAVPSAPSQPSAATLSLHRQAQRALAPGQIQTLMREAGQGFMVQLPFFGVFKDKSGQTVLDLSPYDFLKSSEAPASVHPRLWLQARLLMEGGLFKVAERIYQVRGADFANMTLIEGKTGLIVVDPLSSVETAQLALGLYYACRPGLPVAAVVYTGASPDRYGGAEGVCPPEDVKAGRVRVIAPAGFMRRVLAEARLEGFARSRRLGFERGDFLAPGPLGQVGADAGMRSAEGLSALLPPTEFVGPGRTRLAVDGLTLEFFAEGEGALPGSMHCYIPELKALLAPRAAMPAMAGDEAAGLAGAAGAYGEPDLLGWSQSLDDALRHAGDAEVMFGARCWPVFGRDAVRTRLVQARDLWRYVHDQTLHLAGQGLGPEAIAQRLRLPDDLAPSLRLAGTPLADIIEAFWRRSVGAVEANPLRMRFFGPAEEGARYVAFMGGPGEVVAKARACMEAGEYRWAVQVLGHVVAAYPGIVPARMLCAEALEQLAYQEEGARRRNLYLSAARELRGGVLPAGRGFLAMASRMAPEDMGAYLALLVNGEKAKGRSLSLSLKAPAWKRPLLLTLERGVLHWDPAPDGEARPDASLAGTQAVLCAVAEGALGLGEAEAQKKLALAGDRSKAEAFLACLEPFEAGYSLTGLPPLPARAQEGGESGMQRAGARFARERALALQPGGGPAQPDGAAETSAQGKQEPSSGQADRHQPVPLPEAEQAQPGQGRRDAPSAPADTPAGAGAEAGKGDGPAGGEASGPRPLAAPSSESSQGSSPETSLEKPAETASERPGAPEAGAAGERQPEAPQPEVRQSEAGQPAVATAPAAPKPAEASVAVRPGAGRDAAVQPDASLPGELAEDRLLWEPVPARAGGPGHGRR